MTKRKKLTESARVNSALQIKINALEEKLTIMTRRAIALKNDVRQKGALIDLLIAEKRLTKEEAAQYCKPITAMKYSDNQRYQNGKEADSLSQCGSCLCMTYTVNNKCGKCNADKKEGGAE